MLIIVAVLAAGYLLGAQVDFAWGGMLLSAALFFWLRAFYFKQFIAHLKAGTRPALVADSIWLGLLSWLNQTRSGSESNRSSQPLLVPAELAQNLLALPFGLVFVKADNTVQQFNSYAEELFGLKTPDDIGANLMHLVRQPDFVKALEQALKDQTEVRSVVLKNYLDKSLFVHIVPYCEMGLILIQDITEAQHTEEARRKLAANISHELRTPLTVIRGYAETLQDQSKESRLLPSFDEALAEVLRHIKQMSDIIENSLFLDQLDARKPDKAQWTQIDISQLAKNVIANEQLRFKEKNCIVKTSIDSEYQIFGSERELYSAFSNLLNNALRHSEDGGEVSLSWHVDEQGGHFSVEDKGEGIDAGEIAFLTERFYRIDYSRADRYGGTGLGLAIVKYVLLRHDASLSISSEIGKGSVFRCDFPLSALVKL